MRNIIDFNQGWYFSKETCNPLHPDLTQMEPVTLPHTWNALDGADGDDFYYRGICWYANTFSRPDGECVYLEIPAASLIAKVYLNGQQIAEHQGGFSAFRVDLTPYLKEKDNFLVISADNSENELTYPQFADFTFFGGLYRGAKLVTVPKKHLRMDEGDPGLHVTTTINDDGSAEICMNAASDSAAGEIYLFTVKDAAGQAAGTVSSTDGTCCITLSSPHLWDGINDPYLYTAEVTLKDSRDHTAVSFGIRSYYVDPQKGFFLNHKPYPLRGVSRHQDRQGKGWAISPEDHKEDLELIQELGANSIRLAHYQHAQEFYDLCDRAGIIVWAEIPFISKFMDNPDAVRDTMTQMRELVIQNDNHASICFWGISNEITMKGESNALTENLRALHELCHQLDPSRITTMAQIGAVSVDSPTNCISDVLAYNIYLGWYIGRTKESGVWLDERHRLHPDCAIGLSEYGADANYCIHSEHPKRKDYSEEYQCLYHEEMLRTIEKRPWLWATYVWNMFDFAADRRKEGGTEGRNTKGLVSYDRTVKKDSFYLYKAFWSKVPFVHLTGSRFTDRTGDTVEIKVYSNLPSVSLYCDDKLVETKSGDRIFLFQIPLTGEHTICAKADGCSDSIRIRKVDTPNPSYILEGGSNDGVNWYLDEYGNRQELTKKEGFYSIFDHIGDIMENNAGKAVVDGFLAQVAAAAGASGGQTPAIDENTLSMIKGISISDLIEMTAPDMAQMILPPLNLQLTQIPKDK